MVFTKWEKEDWIDGPWQLGPDRASRCDTFVRRVVRQQCAVEWFLERKIWQCLSTRRCCSWMAKPRAIDKAKSMSQNIPNLDDSLEWDALYRPNMSMIRTGTIPLPKKNSNKPLSQGGYQSRTKLDRLIEVRYLMPWGCERMCAGQATLGECQTEQKKNVRRDEDESSLE